MKLFIAEKPSLARAIADVMPKPHLKKDGYIEVGNGDAVTWCLGHLLEQVEPDEYDPKYKRWNAEHLPIIPQEWQLKPRKDTRKQLTIIRKLVKQASSICHAGDVDREGQLLVDQTINYCKPTKAKLKTAQRCLITDLNPSAVTKAINNLKENADFISLSISALARSRADWLYGMNMTRLCTLQGQKSGYKGVLSIGRVQTPILGLIVHRDLEITNFVSKPFYEVMAEIKTQKGEIYQGKWKPSASCEPYMDEEKRILNRELALNVIRRITEHEGVIVKSSQKNKKQIAPLLHSLSSLQIAAAKMYGLSAKQVLDIAQQLYERHKLITYPRSDCQYLPVEHLNDVSAIKDAIGGVSSKLKPVLSGANFSKKGRAWNDSKVSAHHAIVPTMKKSAGGLGDLELKIYELIARQYIAQFYPDHEYSDKNIETEIAGGLFISHQTDVLKEGWKVLFKSSNKKTDSQAPNLPDVKKGETIFCVKGSLLEKNTTAPKHFTDATLLGALTGISRYVKDANIKKLLKETDGLGTDATRAGIIELLFKRQYLVRKGKDILATEVAIKLITAIPEQMTAPDMTAYWESQLNDIYCKTLNYQTFISGIENNLHQLISEVKQISLTGLPVQNTKPSFKKKRSFKKKG